MVMTNIYDTHVKLPTTDSEWEAEIQGFLEKNQFPCVGAWDALHVQVSSILKSHYSFKKVDSE